MADFLTDKKQRRRDSIYRPYVGDYLKLNESGTNVVGQIGDAKGTGPNHLAAKTNQRDIDHNRNSLSVSYEMFPPCFCGNKLFSTPYFLHYYIPHLSGLSLSALYAPVRDIIASFEGGDDDEDSGTEEFLSSKNQIEISSWTICEHLFFLFFSTPFTNRLPLF